MRTLSIILIMSFELIFNCDIFSQGPGNNSWRYYRTGNTGIQGDYCDAIWIDQNGDPYIGGYDPVFED